MKREEAEALERMKFRARECEVTRRKPFQPVLPHNFTVPDEVVLHSTTRAEERRRFDEILSEKSKEKMRLAEVGISIAVDMRVRIEFYSSVA